MPTKPSIFFTIPSPLQEISLAGSNEKGISVFVKRDDLIHEVIQGNKWRKLKYNLEELQQKRKTRIVTVGGAWSNHLSAVAAACKLLGLRSMAYVRGEIEEKDYSETLKQCTGNGMELKMLSRSQYDLIKEQGYTSIIESAHMNDLFIPEGGSNNNGIKGCMEIRNEIQIPFDYIISAIGSGTTCAGLALACRDKEKVLGVNVFKTSDGLKDMISEKIRLITNDNTLNAALNRLEIINGFSFGGFARVTNELRDFRLSLYKETEIDTDLVYTTKVFYAAYALIHAGFFKKGDKIVILHTGGIQGNQGFQQEINETEKI